MKTQRTSRIKMCFRPSVMSLEERTLLSQGNVLQTNLVSDMPGMAAVTDPNLINPWGISESSTSPFWISDNNAGVSTLYQTPGQNGAPIAINPLVVSIPTPPDPLNSLGTPTGTVANPDPGAFTISGFSQTGDPASAAPHFLFVTEDGTIVGWNPGVNPQGFDPAKAGTYGIIAVDNSGNNFTNPNPLQQTGAVYKGMSIATSASPIFAGDASSTAVIYATNFRSGKIEVYDSSFNAVSLPAGAFTDSKIPAGFAPFNVQILNGQVYVTYAKQNAAKHDNVPGQGLGFVDVFNLDGTPGLAHGKVRLISRGQLNSPWGLAIAPAGFAGISAPHNDSVLLVGNFPQGHINAFDASTGKFLTQLKGPNGKPIQIDGLWALNVGNGGAGGDANTVYFTAGPSHETHGLFGSLSTPAPDPAGGTDVLTYHNDTSRTGANLNETTLTPKNVNASSFGKLFHYDVDGQVYAQPLVVSHLSIGGQVHNVLIVATENDSVYALDANNPTAGPRHNGVLWQDSFIDPAKGITPIPGQDLGSGNPIVPTVGITSTPVIDRATNTLYIVSQVKEQPIGSDGPHYVIQIHALNLLNGKEKDGGPTTVGDTTLNPDGSFTNDTQVSVPGTGAGSADGVVAFNALRDLQRAGLVLDTKVPGHPAGVVFAGFAGFDLDPAHGWLVGYDAKTLKLVTVFNTTPNGEQGGIWAAGGAPSVAPNGDLILSTGNGTFDALTTTTPPGPAAQGEQGFGLGYGGIGQSAAVSFATSIPNDGVSSTGLFFNGDFPTDKPMAPEVYQPLSGTGIDFTAGAEDPNGPHTYQATLSYQGTTLTETITDQTTGASFSRSYTNVDLPSTVGGGTAFVGFGAGTDDRGAVIPVESWTYSSGGKTLIDHSGGFASHGDLTATGVTTFNGAEADLTTGVGPGAQGGGADQAGNLFANSQVNIRDFTTTFTFQMRPEPNSPLGEGLSFIIQNDVGHRPGPDVGESVLRLSPTPGTMTVVDSFTPFDFKARNNTDRDLGSTGVTLLPAFPGTAHPNLAVEADKSGTIRLLDVNNMGGVNPGGPDRVLQEFVADTNPTDNLFYSSPVYFDGKVYIQGDNDVLKAYALKLDPATNTMMLDETPVSQGTTVSGFPGTVPGVSADGTSNGIVWDAQVDGFATGSPAILRAYDANDLSKQLYNSNQVALRDQAGGAVVFTTPTIANGHVYLGAQNEVDVYGLLPQASSASHTVGTAPGAALTPKRGVIATGAFARKSRGISVGGPRPSVGSVLDIAAAKPAARPATTRISRVAAAPIVAPSAGGGDQSVTTLSGNEVTTLNDLVISQSDGASGLVSLPGLKKNGSRQLSWI